MGSVQGSGAAGTPVTLTGTPDINLPVLAFVTGNGPNVPAGFNQVLAVKAYWQLLPNLNTITINQGSGPATFGWAAIMSFLQSNGLTPVFVRHGAGSVQNGTQNLLPAFTPNNGDAIIVSLNFKGNATFFTAPCVYTCSDNVGNNYVQLGNPLFLGGPQGPGDQQITFLALNVPAVATTPNIRQVSGPTPGNLGMDYFVLSASTIIPVNPSIRLLASTGVGI